MSVSDGIEPSWNLARSLSYISNLAAGFEYTGLAHLSAIWLLELSTQDSSRIVSNLAAGFRLWLTQTHHTSRSRLIPHMR